MTATLVPAFDDSTYSFAPRKVRFDYEQTPTHWVPGDPHTTHVVNVLHLVLPPGERWFCEVFREALPLLEDDDLRRDVKAFIGQEATHARAHAVAFEQHLQANGIDPKRFNRLMERTFGLGRKREMWSWLPGPIRRWLVRSYLLWRLALIAGIEHFTAVLGWWILVTRGLDEAGADPEMMQLVRWHGAEEVEHRSVAFDAYRAAGGGYVRRVLTMLGFSIGLVGAWFMGTTYLMRNDKNVTRKRRASLRQFRKAAKQGKLPMLREVFGAVPRYMAPRYHPSHECRTEIAAAYLATSPGAPKPEPAPAPEPAPRRRRLRPLVAAGRV